MSLGSIRGGMTVPRLAAVVLATSAMLLAARVYASFRLGFGDSEALYACYALHPEPIHLDHPGLVGSVARWIGGGFAPTPVRAHLVTAVAATMVPWLGGLAARAMGASPGGALWAVLALLVTPEIAIGTFALTPDLLLIVLWYAALTTAAVAMQRKPGSVDALSAWLVTGILVGLACNAKASGVLLAVGLVAVLASRAGRAHRATLAPWAAAAVAAVVVTPMIADGIARGFPMLRHRLLAPEARMGLSLRNVAALFGGQLLYLSPPLVVAAGVLFADLYRQRDADAMSTLLFRTTAASSPLILLMLASGAAEPHWLAPLYLALPLHLGRRLSPATVPPLGPKLSIAAVACGIGFIALVHVLVLTPTAPRLLGAAYEPRLDITNDLYAWPAGLRGIDKVVEQSRDAGPGSAPPVIVGPHWVVCAQLHAGLGPRVLVGCTGRSQADFAEWLPPSVWRRASVVYYVTDDRFGDGLPSELGGRHSEGVWVLRITRGGVVVRTIRVERLVDRAQARLRAPAPSPG